MLLTINLRYEIRQDLIINRIYGRLFSGPVQSWNDHLKSEQIYLRFSNSTLRGFFGIFTSSKSTIDWWRLIGRPSASSQRQASHRLRILSKSLNWAEYWQFVSPNDNDYWTINNNKHLRTGWSHQSLRCRASIHFQCRVKVFNKAAVCFVIITERD